MKNPEPTRLIRDLAPFPIVLGRFLSTDEARQHLTQPIAHPLG